MYTGPVRQPAPDKRGLKDMFEVNPGEVTRIITTFEPFTGRYVWHCHILEHEDYEMMRPYEVIDRKDRDEHDHLFDEE